MDRAGVPPAAVMETCCVGQIRGRVAVCEGEAEAVTGPGKRC